MDWRTLAQTNLPTVNPQAAASSYRRPTNPSSSYHHGQEDTVGGVGGLRPSAAAAGGGGGGGPVFVVPLETALEQYEQSMLEFILTKAKENTRKSTDRLIQDHVRKHWEMQRDRWLYGLSHHSTAPPNDLEDNDDPYYFGAGGGQIQQGGNGNALTIHTTGPSSNNDPHYYDNYGGRPPLLDANQVRDHYGLVRKVLVSGRRLSTTTTTTTTSGGSNMMSAAARTMVEEFTNLAAVQNNTSSLELRLVPHSYSAHEYVSAWKIIARLMDGGNSSSSFSSPAERARRTALALGQRYREHMMVRLGQLQPPSASPGRNNNNDNMKQQAVEFQNTFVMGDPTIWPALYFCLHVGDARAAIALIEQQRGGLDVDPAVASLLYVLATCQGSSADSVWEKNLDYLFFDRHQVVAVLDLLETMKGNPHHNKYEAGVYSLLAGATPILSETLEGFMTTEDYAYTSICIVLLHAADLSEGLADLGKEIIQQGPAYFRTASPWEYFLPLLAAQQYHRALDWLVRVAPVQGTHLALGFHQANIAIQNHGEADVSEQALTAILVKYAALMEYPEVALTYLSLIADKGRARTEMARIVANQDDLTPVAGMMIATDGKRVGGVLEELVASREEVSEILLAAASLLRVQQGSKKNIVLCLMQSERFDEVLATLNSFLVPVDQPDAERGFWVDNTRFFLRDYVDIVSSPVVQNLAKANKLGILEESRLLVQLNDLMSGRQSNKNLADSSVELLLPRSQDEFDDKKRRFDDFSAAVQSAFGPFLMLRLRTMADEHADLKRQLIGYNNDAARQNIQHNEQLSDLYIRFAKAINLPGKERHAIIQLGSTIS